MSKKKKKRRSLSREKYNKINKEIESPLSKEVNNIQQKIRESEELTFNLKNEKDEITSNLVDKILLNKELRDLLSRYIEIQNELEEEKISQDNRKKDLELKSKKLSIENQNIIKEMNSYIKISDGFTDQKIGLYNSICRYPVAICKQKDVYLSYEDIKYKKCLKHRDHKPCKHLQWLPLETSLITEEDK